jgi:hypothetical protein
VDPRASLEEVEKILDSAGTRTPGRSNAAVLSLSIALPTTAWSSAGQEILRFYPEPEESTTHPHILFKTH